MKRMRPYWGFWFGFFLIALLSRNDAPRAKSEWIGDPLIMTGYSAQTDPRTLPLMQKADLSYVGGFRLPPGSFGGSSFDYSGSGIAFNSSRNSLFVTGHDWHQQTAEVGIPTPVIATTLSALPVAPLLQTFADASEGKSVQIGSGTRKVGGYLVHGGRLIQSWFIYYDNFGALYSHLSRPLNLATKGQVQGMVRLAAGTYNPGFVAGYMGSIPAAWQPLLGGSALTGQCCIPVLARTSFGAAVFAFDPANLTSAVVALLAYTQSNPLAAWDTTNPLFNGTTQITGVVFPEGTRSALLFGRQGIGPYCYGTGLACNDPTDAAKGNHAYPYVSQIWAYDANDLLAVKQGTKKPWEVKPYATWPLTHPFAHGRRSIAGTTYDPATGRVFLSAHYNDGTRPLVHVFKFGAGSTPPPPPPPPVDPCVTAPLVVTITASHTLQPITVTFADTRGCKTTVSK